MADGQLVFIGEAERAEVPTRWLVNLPEVLML
jgi:hypothetical protein